MKRDIYASYQMRNRPFADLDVMEKKIVTSFSRDMFKLSDKHID